MKRPKRKAARTNFAAMASASASVGFKERLTSDELVHALRSAKATPGKEAHFIALLEEAPAELLKGLLAEVRGSEKRATIEKNLDRIAEKLGVTSHAWHKKLA